MIDAPNWLYVYRKVNPNQIAVVYETDDQQFLETKFKQFAKDSPDGVAFVTNNPDIPGLKEINGVVITISNYDDQ